MPITKLTPENNYPYLDDRIKALEQAVPEAFADGKINWETLREVLDEDLEEGGCEEYFGLNWPGKREARKRASIPSRGTLVPAPGEGVNEDDTENLFIEGDNLEVLKLLQKSYAGKIKMIYIDPPYNTGNDFIYNDNFTDPLKAYLEYTGATGESGELLTTNTRSDGRFHSNWLNMMYPRLELAHRLLKEDGGIFVSIDDNEVHHLREVLNEIFGEENFIDCIIWKKRYGGGAKEKFLVSLHEYCLFYAKSASSLGEIQIPLDEESIKRYYKNRDSNYQIRGPYRTHPLEATKSMGDRPNLVFQIPAPDGTKVFPKRQWLWSRERVQGALDKDEIEFIKGKDDEWSVHSKQYLKDENGEIRKGKFFSIVDDVYTQHGTNEIIKLFGDARIFSFPKPSDYITKFIQLITKDDDIILDFFAGSATTAHSVIKQNKIDGYSRKFIMVQIPEKVDESDYSTIAEISRERIRRVIRNNEIDISKEAAETPLLKTKHPNLDLGFKVFAYASSNLKQWETIEEQTVNELSNLFDDLSKPLVQGWKKKDLMSEVLILEGFPLTSEISYQDEILQNEVYRISAPNFCDHKLFICLDEAIQPNTISLLESGKDDIFICLDSALTDELKARVKDMFNVHVI